MIQTKSLSIDGMTCANCIRHVSDALKDVQGLAVKEVGMGVARVEYDPDAVGEAQILAAVRDAGYSAQLEQ